MQITIKRSGNLMEISPWVPALEGLLSFRRVLHKFGQGKPKMEFLHEKLYNIDGDRAQVPAGMFSKVYKELIKHHEVKVEDYRDMAGVMPAPDFTRVGLLREGQDQILLAVAGNDGGLIVGGTGAGKSFCITQICMMYPTLKIVILSPRISVVNTIYDSLTKLMPATAVARIGGGKHDKGARRVTISTTKSALKCDLKHCDLLLFDEAHNVGCNQIAEYLGYATRARKFGFTATPQGRSDGTDIIMEAVFGPRVADIPYEDAVEAGLVTPIEVQIQTVATSGYIPDTQSPVAKKRWNYWRNSSRNNAIARVADTVPDDEQVLIMVETLEHALYLKKLLPKFAVVHYGNVDKDRARKLGVTQESVSLTREQLDTYRKEFSSGVLKKVIATTTWKEGVDFPKLACLIRADGAPGEISSEQIPGRLSRLSTGKDVGILIDFEDQYSTWALARSRKRIAFYRRKGWRLTQFDASSV